MAPPSGGGRIVKVPGIQRTAPPASWAQVGWGQEMGPWGWGKSPPAPDHLLPIPRMGCDLRTLALGAQPHHVNPQL